jgi:hypothetical protein
MVQQATQVLKQGNYCNINHVISRFGDSEWPPRSPSLTAPDFFMGLFKF